MRMYKTALISLLLCIVTFFLASLAISEQVATQEGTSPGSSPQTERGGVGSGKGARRVKSAYQQELEVQTPKIIKAIEASGRPLPKTGAEAQSLGARLAGEGYKRLGDSILLEMLSMLAAMAEVADEQFCAAIWTGSYQWDMVAAPILYLPDERQRRFAQITASAELAEIQNRPPKRPPPSEAVMKSPLKRLFDGLRTDDVRFLLAAFKAPLDMTARDQCRATRVYHRRLKQMAPKDALLVFRSTLYAYTDPIPPH